MERDKFIFLVHLLYLLKLISLINSLVNHHADVLSVKTKKRNESWKEIRFLFKQTKEKKKVSTRVTSKIPQRSHIK